MGIVHRNCGIIHRNCGKNPGVTPGSSNVTSKKRITLSSTSMERMDTTRSCEKTAQEMSQRTTVKVLTRRESVPAYLLIFQ